MSGDSDAPAATTPDFLRKSRRFIPYLQNGFFQKLSSIIYRPPQQISRQSAASHKGGGKEWIRRALDGLPPCCQLRQPLQELPAGGRSVDDLLRGEACLARHHHAVPEMADSIGRVGVGVHGEEAALLRSLAHPAPVEVEPARVGVDQIG